MDLSKSYDRVEWDFLLGVLSNMGFDPRWVQLISECIFTVRFSVIVNGSVSSSFNPKRGLRQRDPFSTYLFLLVQDVLSRVIDKARVSNQFE